MRTSGLWVPALPYHCKAAALMFGEYLSNHCGIDSDQLYYARETRNDEIHGWLIYDGWIVDLTSDQFDDEERKVIVEEEGDSKWIKPFDNIPKYRFNLRRSHNFVEVAGEIAGRVRKRDIRT